MTATSKIQPAYRDMISLRRHLAALAGLPETEAPVLSVFLDLRRPMDSLRSSFQMWASGVRGAVPKGARGAFDAARAEMGVVFSQEWPESVRSVAAYVRTGDAPLLLVMPFHATMETHFQVSGTPAIFPLVQLKDRFHRFVAVICTEESSRIFEITLGSITEQILATKAEPQRRVGREWTREHYHQRKRENDRRFVKEQIEIIQNLMARRGHNHLILAGHPRCVAALRGELPKELEGRVADTVFQAPNGQDCSLVLEQAVAAFIEAEEHESRGVVERLHQEICRGGLAVVGVERVREVMRMGAASELVISENLAIADREELVRLATSLDLAVEVCENDEVLDDHGGVGCLLRYRVDYPGLQVGDGEG